MKALSTTVVKITKVLIIYAARLCSFISILSPSLEVLRIFKNSVRSKLNKNMIKVPTKSYNHAPYD